MVRAALAALFCLALLPPPVFAQDEWSPIKTAAFHGDLDILRKLLDDGTPVDDRDRYQATPLMTAAARGHLDVVRLLLERGADIDAQNKYGWTALMLAIEARQAAVARELLARGAATGLRSWDGKTAQGIAAAMGLEALFDPSAPPPEAVEPPPPPPPPPPTEVGTDRQPPGPELQDVVEERRRQQVRRLLARAQRQMVFRRLLEPAGDNAVDSYRQVLTLEPDNEEARSALADIAGDQLRQARQAGDPAASLAAVQGGLRAQPDNRELLSLRAELTGEPDPAEAERLAAERRREEQRRRQVADLLALARDRIKAGRLIEPAGDSAADGYRQVLDLDPGNAEAAAGLRELVRTLTGQARQQRQAGDLEGALAAIEQGLRVDPGDQDLLALRQAVQTDQAERERQRQEAERRQRRIADLLTAAERRFQAGRLIEPAGDSAADRYRQVLDLDPGNSAARAGLAQLAATFAERAARAQQAGDLEASLAAIDQGLSVLADDRTLLALREAVQVKQAERERQRLEAERRTRQLAELLAAARRQSQAGRLVEPEGDNALDSYRRLLTLDPGNAEAAAGLRELVRTLTGQARQQRQAGDLEGALAAIEQGLRVDPGDQDLLALRQAVQTDQAERERQRQEAERRAQQVAELLNQAHRQARAGQLLAPEGDNAVASYRRVLELEPDNAVARVGLQRVVEHYAQETRRQRQEGRLEAALAAVEQGLSVAPDDADLLALAEAVRGELAERQRRAQQVAEGLAAAQRQLQAGRLVEPEGDNAAASYRAVLELEPDNAAAGAGLERIVQALGARAERERRAGELEAALATLDQALGVAPDDPKLRERRRALEDELAGRRRIAELLAAAQRQLQAGRLVEPEGDNAAASYRAVLELEPDNAAAGAGLERIAAGYLRLAQGRLEAGALEPALAAAETGLSVAPDQTLLLQLRDRARAELAERERRARELATLLAQAQVQEQAGRLAAPPGDNAVDSFRRVLELEPDHPQAKATLERLAGRLAEAAQRRLRAGELEAALAEAEGGLRADPGRGELLDLREDIQARIAERERRRREIESLLAAARRQTEAGRLTEPEGDNAQASYRAVLEMDPDNAAAKAGLQELLDRAEQDLKNKLAEWQRMQEQLDAEERAIRESIQRMLSEDRERRSE